MITAVGMDGKAAPNCRTTSPVVVFALMLRRPTCPESLSGRPPTSALFCIGVVCTRLSNQPSPQIVRTWPLNDNGGGNGRQGGSELQDNEPRCRLRAYVAAAYLSRI